MIRYLPRCCPAFNPLPVLPSVLRAITLHSRLHVPVTAPPPALAVGFSASVFPQQNHESAPRKRSRFNKITYIYVCVCVCCLFPAVLTLQIALATVDEESDSAMDRVTNPTLEVCETKTPGVTYNLHTASVFDQYQREVIKMIPNSRLGAPRVFSEQERLDQHTYSVLPLLAGLPGQTAFVKLQYVRRQLLAELGLAQV